MGDLVCLSKKHGTHHAHRRYGCRCRATLEYMAAYQNQRRAERRATGASRVVDATATHRRIRALFAAGWTGEELSRRLGYDRPWAVRDFLSSGKVLRSTAEKIEALFGELEAKPGPSRLNQMRSTHKGWAPPLAWDEDTIADPTAAPEGLTRSTRKNFSAETVWEYTLTRESGLTHAQTLRELGISEDAWQQAARRTGFSTGKGPL